MLRSFTGGNGGEGRFKSNYSFLYLTFRVKILGGKIQTYGQTHGIYSVNGDVEISGGNVRAEEFRSSGVYTKRGDIKVGGDAKLYVSSYKNSSTSGIKAVNKDAKGGNVFFYGGETEVLVPNIGV